jgi:WD40 repeat protein
LLVNGSTGRFELSRPVGTVIASGVRSLGSDVRIVGDGPVVAFLAKDPDAVGLRDLEKDRLIWQHPCGHCTEFSVSDDGSRFVQVSLDDGLEVWDTRSDRRLFHDNRRVKVQTMATISGDGRLLAWNTLDTLVVRDLSSGQEDTVPLDSGVRGLGFSPDSSQLATVSSSSVTLRETVTGRELWKVPQDASQFVDVNWSPDRRFLILKHGWIATEVLDATNGERLARFSGLSRAVTPVVAELYSPDLRVKAVSALTTWEIRPVPSPDETPAAESLARTLRKTGLEFRGVELVAAP